MISDLRLAFASRSFLLILGLSALFRSISFITLPDSPSIFGPDEGTYAALAKYVSTGLPVQEFPVYGPDLYNTSKALTLPGAILVTIGMNELHAVRIISSLYGLLSILAVALCFITMQQIKQQKLLDTNLDFQRTQTFFLALFSFLPSNFVWSVIGLRESASQFWIIASSYFLLKVRVYFGKRTLVYAFLAFISITLAFVARPETALIFTVLAAFFCLLYAFVSRHMTALIIVLLGVIAGTFFSSSPPVKTEIYFEVTQLGSTKSDKPDGKSESNEQIYRALSRYCTEENQIIRFKQEKLLCKERVEFQKTKKVSGEMFQKKLLTPQQLTDKRNVNAVNSVSSLPQSKCNLFSDLIRVLTCSVSELPYRLFSLLFRPLVFIDQGTPFFFYASLENLLWLIIVPFAIFKSLQRNQTSKSRFLNLFLVSYMICFASAAALYEGNLGTAFRHKSSLLWSVILILMINARYAQKRHILN